MSPRHAPRRSPAPAAPLPPAPAPPPHAAEHQTSAATSSLTRSIRQTGTGPMWPLEPDLLQSEGRDNLSRLSTRLLPVSSLRLHKRQHPVKNEQPCHHWDEEQNQTENPQRSEFYSDIIPPEPRPQDSECRVRAKTDSPLKQCRRERKPFQTRQGPDYKLFTSCLSVSSSTAKSKLGNKKTARNADKDGGGGAGKEKVVKTVGGWVLSSSPTLP
ncbi:unnamed protein product [Pleuronectes platessa]|uniref:Uncharacterized protein n=1 Tax=Pleuronectes platessa TaxID=8262 RepID=A0A9N7Y7F4_PLEPL|nr:unnamed protein product [Pleuronectes platessa]